MTSWPVTRSVSNYFAAKPNTPTSRLPLKIIKYTNTFRFLTELKINGKIKDNKNKLEVEIMGFNYLKD